VEGGYASPDSVPQGSRVNFHISTAAPVYTLRIYREGAERLLFEVVTGLDGVERECPEPGYATGCGWPVSHSLQVPTDWPSGVYTVEFNTGSAGSGKKLLVFVVREDAPGSTSPILFTLATNTHQAYNGFGGKSLYSFNSSGGIPATQVSFERPYAFEGDGNYFKREHPFVQWAEASGYPIEYATNVDLHADPSLLSHYSAFVCCGHDEYWSREMRDHLDAFVGAGGRAAILSGNTCWWQVRYSPDLRTVICYKSTALKDDPLAIDGIASNDHLVTTNWYQPPVSYPENSTTGLGWRDGGYHDNGGDFPASAGWGGYRVYRTAHWAFAGTGLTDGTEIGRAATIVGYEVDGTLLEARDAAGNLAWDANRYFPLPGALPHVVKTDITKTPANFEILALAPASRGHAVMGTFERGAGSVFNAGSIDWVQGLASDLAVARITANVLDRFGGISAGGNARPAAVIDESGPGFAPVGALVTLAGHGTDADGAIARHLWLSSLDGYLASTASFSTSSLSLGLHSLYYLVSDDRGAWSAKAEALLQVHPPGQLEIILDDGQPGTSFTGSWQPSGGASPYGLGSLYSKGAGTTYTYTVPLPATGEHEVFLWWTTWPSRLSAVPVSVTHAAGKAQVTVNQQVSGGQWNSLGRWQFGASAVITITSLGPGTTCADAVRLVPATTSNPPPVATIDAVTPRSADRGSLITFAGHGTDLNGSIVAHEWRSSLDGALSSLASFSTSSLTVGLHRIAFRVRDNDGAWSEAAETTVEISAPGAEPLVLDNGDPRTSSTRLWSVSGASAPFGDASLFSKTLGATYSYTATLAPGVYEVSLWWTTWPSRLNAVPVTVDHELGTAKVTVNQQSNGGQWNPIGRWQISSQAIVTIESLGGGSTCADAVRFAPVASTNTPPSAILDDVPPSPAFAGVTLTFSGLGTDVEGPIAAFEWSSSLDGLLSTAASFSSAALSVGEHTVSFRVRDRDGEWSDPATTTLTVLELSSLPIVIDNGDPGTSSTGPWITSGALAPFGASSLYSRTAGATYTFSTPLAPGTYEVSLWWTTWPSRETAVPVSVLHAGGTASSTVNQQQRGGQWNAIGTWSFGSQGSVSIKSLGPGSTCADAVRWVRVGP
jgi:hypothetical protein